MSMCSFDMLNIVMILYEKISRLIYLIEIMQNKISNNLFESIHFATATLYNIIFTMQESFSKL